MKEIKNKLQQMIKNIKTFFINKLCVSSKKETEKFGENEKSGKFGFFKILKGIFMSENETTQPSKMRFENDKLFNKNLILITTGGLIITVGFLEKTIPIYLATHIWCLYFGWFILVLTLGLTLYSFLYSSDLGQYLEEKSCEFKDNDDLYNNEVKIVNKKITKLNYFIFSLMCLGLIFLFIFVITNFDKKNNMEENKKTQQVELIKEGLNYSFRNSSPKTIVITKPENTEVKVTDTNNVVNIVITQKEIDEKNKNSK